MFIIILRKLKLVNYYYLKYYPDKIGCWQVWNRFIPLDSLQYRPLDYLQCSLQFLLVLVFCCMFSFKWIKFLVISNSSLFSLRSSFFSLFLFSLIVLVLYILYLLFNLCNSLLQFLLYNRWILLWVVQLHFTLTEFQFLNLRTLNA